MRLGQSNLFSQTILEKDIDVATIYESKSDSHGVIWIKDQIGQAALWAWSEQAIQKVMKHPEDGFIRAKVKITYIYSCNFPTSVILADYKEILSALVLDVDRKL